MRITGGEAGGLRISSVPGRDIRPTSDRVREALFQILSVKLDYDWSGNNVLDLFAGTGSLGIEALSRGAEHAVFADISPRSLKCVRANLEKTTMLSVSALCRLDLEKTRSAARILERYAPFSIVFADPPYGHDLWTHIFRLAHCFPLMKNDGWLVMEEFRGTDMPNDVSVHEGRLGLEDIRSYGQTSLYFFRQMGRLS